MSDQVVVIEKYFTNEEVSEMLHYAEKIKSPGHIDNIGGAYGFRTSVEADRLSLDNPITQLTGNTSDDNSILAFTQGAIRVKKEIERSFGLELSFTNCMYAYMLPGATNPLHSDNSRLDGTPYHEDEETDYSALIYLNDSGTDYKGGDIFFPLQDLTISPKSGTVIFFKGDYHHPHGVTEVTEGERKTIVLFFALRGNISDRPLFSDEYSGVPVEAEDYSGLTLE
jgi:predicted 2-oxoglutarate/Fe(II)-dependent dioxygenase YbiX